MHLVSGVILQRIYNYFVSGILCANYIMFLCFSFLPCLQLPESESKAWWDQFMMEYFHDLATLVIEIDFGEGMQRYSELID